MIITKNSKSTTSIFSVKESKRASQILKNYLELITDAKFTLYTEDTNLKTSLEDNSKLSSIVNKILFVLDSSNGENGFSYHIDENILYFKAKNEQAFVYSVYDFLEQIIGCSFYSSDYEFVPKIQTLDINFAPYSFNPPINYREIFYKDFESPIFAEKLKMNTSKEHESWGFWCHSFQVLLPYDLFHEHPEYFALIDGKRNPKGEPCLSNPNVRKIIKENLKKFMDEKPECKYWSVSQNDDNLYCRCPKCVARDAYDGTQMGSILDFINEVANEFPDKVISTLAYWYSRKPPKHTRPASNVHIMLCNIEANRGLPIETDPTNKEVREELLDWSKICKNISLWDYNIQFANLVSPFPNLRTLGPNMRYFVKNNLKLLFSQCNREIGGEFAKLRGYMLAKLAWNPDCDEFYHMKNFCDKYYKEASPFILEYIELIHDAQEKFNERLDIFNGPKNAENTYLSLDLYNKYNDLFDKAYEKTKYDEDLFTRVQEARLPLYYAGIVLKYGTLEEQLLNIKEFAKIANKVNLKMVEEWKITTEKFLMDSLIALD
ncbi:DUF4838 domain-containing protein [Clostridium perfringens]|nr:DUF4838 domain-containing protein [Clostridium perfringens]